jgi:hypothetical protein
MDPVTIVTSSLAIAKFAGTLSISVGDAWSRYKEAEKHVHGLVALLHSLKIAMTSLSKNVVTTLDGDLESSLDDDTNAAVEVSVKACASLMRELNDYITSVQGKNSELSSWTKVKFVWKDSDITRLEERLDRQINALNLVLTVLLAHQYVMVTLKLLSVAGFG